MPGLVLIRQRPGSAEGIVFLTIEDEHGVANLVVYEQIAMRDRAALVSGQLLIAEGRVEREVEHAEVPITHLIVRRLLDRSDLLNRLVGDRLRKAGTPGLSGVSFRNRVNEERGRQHFGRYVPPGNGHFPDILVQAKVAQQARRPSSKQNTAKGGGTG
jgi:DNA polymerase III alpha subunit